MQFSKVMVIVVFPLATLSFMVLTFYFGLQGQLPDPVAVHWGATGEADGFMALGSYLGLIGSAFILFWLGLLALELVPVRARLLRPLISAFGGYLYGLILVLMALTTFMQIGGNAAQSSNIGLWILLIFIPVGFLIWLLLSRPVISMDGFLEIRLRGLKVISIPAADVVKVTRGELRGRDFGGWGIRYATKTLAFIRNSGPSVIFELNWGEKIAVRIDDNDQLANLITKK